MTDSRDYALETLLEIRNEAGIDLDERLLKSIFAIQKRYQFSRDRVQPTRLMNGVIDEHVEELLLRLTNEARQ